jgi:hypothetical protein
MRARGYPRVSPDTMQMMLDYPDTSLQEMMVATGPIKSPIQRIRISQYLRNARDVLAPELMGLVKDDVFGK